MANADNAIRVRGLDRLVKDLKNWEPELRGELKDVNRELAQSLVPVARGIVPRRSGALERTIRAGVTARSGVVRAGTSRVRYGGPIHFGWPRRGIAPQPFLWDALDQRRSVIEREYVQRVQALANKVG